MTDGSPGGMDRAALEGAVVVGDDASAASRAAVAWAREDAARRGVPLVVVRAWSLTNAPRPSGAEHGYVPSEDEYAEAVRAEMAHDLQGTVGDLAEGSVILMPAHCSATDALLHASHHAALTVVGARGSGLARWLGSVASAVVKSASGPVVVVPDRRRPEG